jgi:hypothetical protein
LVVVSTTDHFDILKKAGVLVTLVKEISAYATEVFEHALLLQLFEDLDFLRGRRVSVTKLNFVDEHRRWFLVAG